MLLLLGLAGCGGGESGTSDASPEEGEAAIPVDRMLPTPDQVAAEEEPEMAVPSTEFVGTWAVQDDDGKIFNIVVFPDGRAITNFTKGVSGTRGEFGEWSAEDGTIRLHYDSGWKDVLLRQDDGSYLKLGYAPGITLNDQPSNEDKAEKVTGPAEAYTGVWYRAAAPKGQPWFLVLRSDNSAERSDAPDVAGKWHVSAPGQAEVRWEDGLVTALQALDEPGETVLSETTSNGENGAAVSAGKLLMVRQQMGSTPEQPTTPDDPDSMEDVSLEPGGPAGS
ncbi:MAG: hypothetical protein AAGK14_11005 [Verrucomicrobiota bacterium]